MTTQLDFTVGIGRETTYGTAVAPTRFAESDAKMKYDVKTIQSKGLRPGKNVNRLNRNAIGRFEGSGDVAFDVPTRGFGMWLNAVLGAVVSTVVPSTTPALYQQVHTISTTDPVQTFTLQEVLPTLGGVNSYPHTFTGCAFDSIELSAKEGGFVEAKLSVTARELLTSFAASAASYPADDALFTFVHGGISLGGTLTPATATAPASMSGTSAANIADFSFAIKRSLDSDGWNLGGKGLRSRAPLLGLPELSGKITAEYTDNALRDAYLAQTPLSLLLTFEHNVAVSGANKPMLQIALPAIRLKGEVPASDGGNAIKLSIDFEAFDDGISAQPVTVVYRTLDAAV
ncbi:phage tail tube protein [uncultured Microbacterium sp.]|uniref:phage tail tube protein n=1 Tax=uncultured Microbacterium sp. TaxID=191216 RepID=UPI0025D3725D|nr:phage tail tube protein [uncultured Microbacterium sp.]